MLSRTIGLFPVLTLFPLPGCTFSTWITSVSAPLWNHPWSCRQNLLDLTSPHRFLRWSCALWSPYCLVLISLPHFQGGGLAVLLRLPSGIEGEGGKEVFQKQKTPFCSSSFVAFPQESLVFLSESLSEVCFPATEAILSTDLMMLYIYQEEGPVLHVQAPRYKRCLPLACIPSESFPVPFASLFCPVAQVKGEPLLDNQGRWGLQSLPSTGSYLVPWDSDRCSPPPFQGHSCWGAHGKAI